MAHTGEKFLLGGVGIIRRLAGRLESLLLPHLLAFTVGDILSGIDDGPRSPVFIGLGHDSCHPDPAVFFRPGNWVFRQLPVCNRHIGMLFAQDRPEILDA